MTWLTPLTGVLLAAAVIPPLVILYFLKLRRQTQPIASTLLWQQAVEDLRANAPFQRLRKSLLLLLQLIALTLLVLAVMQPRLQAGQSEGGKTVILIDNSASMAATDVDAPDATRLEAAKRLAKQRIEQLYAGGLFSGDAGETMIVTFAGRAEVKKRFTSNKEQLLQAIDQIEPTHGTSNIADALKLARAYTTNVNPEQQGRITIEPATLELFSDGVIADLNEQVLKGETLIYSPVGSSEADNIAIATVSVERPYDQPENVQVFAALLNFNQTQSAFDVQLSVNGIARGIEEMSLPPARLEDGLLIPGQNNVVFAPFAQPGESIIEVAVLRADDLMLDNSAQIAVPPPKRLRVALVNQSSFLIKTVLEGMPLQSLDTLSPSEYETAAGEGWLERYDVIVLDNYAPLNMPPARYLTLGETPPLDGINEYGKGQEQIIVDASPDHPAFRFVTLDNLYIARFAATQPADDVKVLAMGSTAPAVLGISRGAMQVIHVTFDPLDSNWPFQRSFVTFLFNAIEYLGNIDQALTARSYSPGEAILTRLPTGARNIDMQKPDGSVEKDLIPLDPQQFSWGPIRLTGLHELRWDDPALEGRQARPFAVNLFSPAESTISAAGDITVGQDVVAGSSESSDAYTPLWPWAIGFCLAVMMLEWWVYHRKAFF